MVINACIFVSSSAANKLIIALAKSFGPILGISSYGKGSNTNLHAKNGNRTLVTNLKGFVISLAALAASFGGKSIAPMVRD